MAITISAEHAFLVTKDKTEAATEGDDTSLTEHLKGGNTAFGDFTGF